MRQEVLCSRVFRVSYEDGCIPYVSYKDDNRPVLVTVTDCFSKDIVSTFMTTPKDLYNVLVERGYLSYG